jgi:hypothetical protein
MTAGVRPNKCMKLPSRLAALAVLSATRRCWISAAKAPACSLCTSR